MECMSLQDIIVAAQGDLIQGDPSCIINGISTDSRTVKVGDMFICLKGEKFDGHRFIYDVADKGAVAVVVHESEGIWPQDINVVRVNDTLNALCDISGYYRRLFDIPVVAVTGSTGKTTTKDMIHMLLSTCYNTLKTQGNLNNEIGLPLTLLSLERHHQIAVVEMGMSGFGEISRMTMAAMPTVGVITNIGLSHIEKLGSRENILRAKMEIFESFHNGCTAVLNGDDDLLWKVQEVFCFPINYFGTKDGVPFQADNIQNRDGLGVSYTLNAENNSYPVVMNVPGRHIVYNSLAAIAVARMFGVGFEEIQKELPDFRTGTMRLNIIQANKGITIIDDVYNANPDSMKAAISVLKDLRGKRKIAVLGDMLEMGAYSVPGHRCVGSAIKESCIDMLITKGKDSRWIGEQAQELGMDACQIYHFDRNEEVIDLLKTFVQSDDTILVKGSRGMNMEDVVCHLRERWIG